MIVTLWLLQRWALFDELFKVVLFGSQFADLVQIVEFLDLGFVVFLDPRVDFHHKTDHDVEHNPDRQEIVEGEVVARSWRVIIQFRVHVSILVPLVTAQHAVHHQQTAHGVVEI